MKRRTWLGIVVAPPCDGLVLVPGTGAGADRGVRWRVATLVNPERTDFVTGFVHAGFDPAGRPVLPVDENAVDIGGLRIESVLPSVAFRSKTRQLLLYGLIAVVFALGLVARYWKAA